MFVCGFGGFWVFLSYKKEEFGAKSRGAEEKDEGSGKLAVLQLAGTGAGHAPRTPQRAHLDPAAIFCAIFFANMASYAVISVCVVASVCVREREGGKQRERVGGG